MNLDEMKTEIDTTPPSTSKREVECDPCALVVRDKRRVRINADGEITNELSDPYFNQRLVVVVNPDGMAEYKKASDVIPFDLDLRQECAHLNRAMMRPGMHMGGVRD